MMLPAGTGTAWEQPERLGRLGPTIFFGEAVKKGEPAPKEDQMKQNQQMCIMPRYALKDIFEVKMLKELLTLAGSSTLRGTKTETELPKAVHVIQSRSRSRSRP